MKRGTTAQGPSHHTALPATIRLDPGSRSLAISFPGPRRFRDPWGWWPGWFLAGHQSISQSVSSVAQLHPTLCDFMDCRMPGFPVHHQLPEFAQTQVHRVGDAIQPSHPLLSPFLAFSASESFPRNPFFASDGQSIGVAASAPVLPVNI